MPIFETTIKYEADDGAAAQQCEREIRLALSRRVTLVSLTTQRRD